MSATLPLGKSGHALTLLEALLDRGLIDIRPGTVTHLATLHDNSCPCLVKGADSRGCNCDPEIEIRGTTYRYSEITREEPGK